MTRSKIASLRRAINRELIREIKNDRQGKVNLQQGMPDFIKNNRLY